MNKFAKINDNGEFLYTAAFASTEHFPIDDPSMVEVPITFELDDTLFFDVAEMAIKDRGARPLNHIWLDNRWVYDTAQGIEHARAEVHLRLATTDYLMIDFPLANKEAWLAYRAALRALNTDDPQNIVWPEVPQVIKST